MVSLDVVSPAVNAWHELRAVAGAMVRYHQHLIHDDHGSEPLETSRPGPTWVNAPVVLVHGIGHNSSAWINLADRLRAAGFPDLHAVGYGLGADVPSIATTIERVANRALRISGQERVHIVAHSLGGVAVRYWHDVLDGQRRADAIVSLGAPHGGTPWAALSSYRDEHRPGARFARSGHAQRLPAVDDDRWFSRRRGAGVFVAPPDVARIDLAGIGHAGLLSITGGRGNGLRGTARGRVPAISPDDPDPRSPPGRAV